MAKKIYSVGQKLGNCVYLGNDFVSNRNRYATFECECGNHFTAAIFKIKSGHTSSCGCLHIGGLVKRNTRHGFAKRGQKSKEYNIWILMKQRCYNPEAEGYKEWGGRGIEVCDRWLQSFSNFIEDMGCCPTECDSIHRIDNDGNYSKENCKWATYEEQANNTRRNIFVEYRGQTKTVSEWSKTLNMPYGTIRRRIVDCEWDAEKSFNTPIKNNYARESN